MGKKKAKRDKAAARAELPKRIGGVKLPKELRKQGEALVGQALASFDPERMAGGLARAARVFARLDAGVREAPPPHAARPPVNYERVGRVMGAIAMTTLSAAMASFAERVARSAEPASPDPAVVQPTPAPPVSG